MNQADHEVNFWKGLVVSLGIDGFLELRKKDWFEKTKFFRNSIDKEQGQGIDVGCGPHSIFEQSDLDIVAIDPLMNQYKELIDLPVRNPHLNMSGEEIGLTPLTQKGR
jgi:hypothetical protein